MGLEPVAEEEEEVIHFKAIYRSHNLLKRPFEPKATVVSSLLLDPQVHFLAYYSLQSVLKPTTVNASPYSAYSCIQSPI